MRFRNARGFTLIEVMVALALSAGVLVGARGLFVAMGDQVQSQLTRARIADTRWNGVQLLRRSFADLVVRDDTMPSLVGTATSMAFSTACTTARGRSEPCALHLAVERMADEERILMRLDSTPAFVVQASPPGTEFRYLVSADDGGHWTSRWQGTVMLPLAVAIVSERDTLLLPIGDRR